MSRAPGDPLRVGIFTDDFYPHSGGVTRSIEQQIDHLTALGHHVTLFAPRFEFTAPRGCAWEALDYWRFPGTPSFLCSVQVGRRLARRIAAGHLLDVVHSQNERGSIYLAAQVAKAGGIPHVHTFHSNYVGTHHTSPAVSGLNSLTYLPLSGRLLRLVSGRSPSAALRLPPSPGAGEDSGFARRDWRSLARLAQGVDAFTSPAGFMIECITDASPELAERGYVVPSGVAGDFLAVTRRRPQQATTRFVSCGRLGGEKRVDAIIQAFGALGRDDAELVIIGDGPELKALQQLAATVRHGHIHFLGHVDEVADIAQQLADADVFVLASYHFDTQGMVLAEAAATGTPILYCDERLSIGVGTDNALLTGPAVTDIARGMAELMDDPTRRASMAHASRTLASGLSGTAMAEAYAGVYRSAQRAFASQS